MLLGKLDRLSILSKLCILLLMSLFRNLSSLFVDLLLLASLSRLGCLGFLDTLALVGKLSGLLLGLPNSVTLFSTLSVLDFIIIHLGLVAKFTIMGLGWSCGSLLGWPSDLLMSLLW